jgi:hypothetical protein
VDNLNEKYIPDTATASPPYLPTPEPQPEMKEEGEGVKGYVEGYFDPVLMYQTDNWWRSFRACAGEKCVPDAGKTSGLYQPDEEGGDNGKEGFRKEMGEEWNAARYFAPSQPSCTGSAEPWFGCEKRREQEPRAADGIFEIQVLMDQGLDIAELRSGEKRKQECKGRDDWECDFCGLECFCWTVAASVSEAW